MRLIYDLFISLFDFFLRVSSNFNKKSRYIYLGRKRTFKYILKNNLENQNLVWIHVSSVGEFEQAKPIIDSIKKKYNHKILISYFSSSTESPVSKYKNVDYHFYIVSDKIKSMKSLFNLFKPKVLILIKYEFWYNLIKEAKLNSIPIISVSSVFRKNQIYFYPGHFFKNILRNVTLFLVQNEESLNLLKKINIKNVKIIGDTRYDRVLEIFNNSKDLDSIREFINNKNTIIIGSSWRSDIEIIKNEIIRDYTDTKYIIVPHNINTSELDYLESTFMNDTIKYSELPQKNIRKRILIVDKYGLLSSIYKYGKMTLIGGGFRGALHNTLEAAVWDIPVLYGFNKKNRKFIEVKSLEENGIGFPIKDGNEFKLIKNRILKNRNVGKGGNKFIVENSGAINKIDILLKKYFK